MRKLIIGIILALYSFSSADDLNWNGWGDTNQIVGFNGTLSKYSKAFILGTSENCRFEVYANDTLHPGYSSDSIKFAWWLEIGHPTPTSTGAQCTTWSKLTPVNMDTFDILTAANMVAQPIILGNDGSLTPAVPLKTIDTLTVSGYAYQSRELTMPWNVFVRFGLKGLAGNITSKYVKTRVQVCRRIATIVKVK